MIIKLSDIQGGKASYQIHDGGWFPRDVMVPVSSMSGGLTLLRVSETEVHATGEFSVTVRVACDRCGRPAQLHLSDDFMYNCVVGKEEPHQHNEVECGDEDVNKLYLEEPIINAGEMLREQVLLAMPLGLHCDPLCKGLCPGCGADLNREKCRCDSTDENSPFAVLKKLKGR